MQGTLYPAKGRGLIPGAGAEEAAEAGRRREKVRAQWARARSEGTRGRPWGEEGALLAWARWPRWTSKLRLCSEDAGLSLPQRDRCLFDGKKKGCCTWTVAEGAGGD